MFFGVAGIAGSLATVFIFFAIEHRWREVLPTFFPEGDLGAVRGVVCLPVRMRLLVMCRMVGVLPLSSHADVRQGSAQWVDLMWSARRRASARMVRVGAPAPAVGNTELPAT